MQILNIHCHFQCLHLPHSASALSPFVAANLIMATPPADAGLSGLHGNYDDEPSSDSLPDFE